MLKQFLAVAALMTLPFTASAADINLRFAVITAEAFPYTDGAMKFKELVEAGSGGEIAVEFYPGGQLGTEREINEQILEGTVQIGVGAGAMSALAPIYNILQMPFLIRGQEHMAKIADGPIGEKFATLIEEQAGFKVIGWFSTGDSPIETTSKPIHTPADLDGLKIRVIEAPVMLDAMRALGANPTPMAYAEVYSGLKQGVVEGAHLDVVSVDTLKIYEVAKYATDWQQITFVSEPRPLIMSAEFFNTLSPAHQQLILESMAEAAIVERQVFVDRMNSIREKMTEAGIEITSVDVDAFVEKMQPVWKKYAADIGAEDILDEILAIVP